jgi:hypothetical protein
MPYIHYIGSATKRSSNMAVIYEWDCETVADGDTPSFEDGEVIDHCHAAVYQDVLKRAKTDAPAGFRHEVVLVRDDEEGRSWAYVENGKLPEFFTDADGADASKVPQRFHQEVGRA